MKKFKLKRRSFLKGVGVSISLPLLEIMQNEKAYSQDSEPLRMVSMMVPNGLVVNINEWVPNATGANFQLKTQLASLAPFKNDINILSNLRNYYGDVDGAGDHARGASTYLGGQRIYKDRVEASITYDQVAANAIGQGNTFPSLELATEAPEYADSGYSDVYKNHSWRNQSTPNPPSTDPYLVFRRLFGDENVGQAESARRLVNRRSILDFVLEDSKRLQKKLGKADNQKLEQYLNGIREVERRIELSQNSNSTCSQSPNPPQSFANYQEHIEQMMDLIVLAFSCDKSRVVTFMMGNEGSNRSFGGLGGFNFSEGWHTVSHFNELDSPFRTPAYRQICTWMVERLPYFLQKMKDTPVGDKNMLDLSMVTFGSTMQSGDSHTDRDLPLIYAGKAGGAIDTGKHIRYAANTPICNLWLTILQRLGIDVDSFGDSTGTLNI